MSRSCHGGFQKRSLGFYCRFFLLQKHLKLFLQVSFELGLLCGETFSIFIIGIEIYQFIGKIEFFLGDGFSACERDIERVFEFVFMNLFVIRLIFLKDFELIIELQDQVLVVDLLMVNFLYLMIEIGLDLMIEFVCSGVSLFVHQCGNIVEAFSNWRVVLRSLQLEHFQQQTLHILQFSKNSFQLLLFSCVLLLQGLVLFLVTKYQTLSCLQSLLVVLYLLAHRLYQ